MLAVTAPRLSGRVQPDRPIFDNAASIPLLIWSGLSSPTGSDGFCMAGLPPLVPKRPLARTIRVELNGVPWGPWVESFNGGHYEIEAEDDGKS